ncbi:Ankyrin repeat and FYVE domain-containing protein 1 [Mactra antiquata]
MHKTDQLHRAIQVELLQEVKKLVNDGANMDLVMGMRGTALCAAIETRNYDITKYLLDSGCDINAQDFDGEPPLLLAIRKESPGKICGKAANMGIIRLLMNHLKCNLNKIDPLTKKSALHFATEQNMAQVVEWLLKSKSEIKCNINMFDANGNSPLHLAVLEGHSDCVNILVNSKDCLLKVYNRAGLTPLHVCARNGDLKNTQSLLNRISGSKHDQLENSIDPSKFTDSEMDINVNAETKFEKETCLHIAARQGHVETVKCLLEHGARTNVKNNVNSTPLLVAIAARPQWQTRNNEIPRLLLKYGANPNMVFGLGGKPFVAYPQHSSKCVHHDLDITPLILAAKNNNLELVKLLVSNGADINLSNRLGQNALFVALKEQALTVASYFITECKEINFNKCTEEGDTCLHALVQRSKKQDPNAVIDMVKVMMLGKGAKVLANLSSETPVDIAFQYGDNVLADAILEMADTDIKDIMQTEDRLHNLMCAAVESGRIDLLRVLLAHGVDIDLKCQTFYRQGDTNCSFLYLALESTEYSMAEYLVCNGLDLRGEKYIFAEVDVPHGNSIDYKNGAPNDDDDNSDDDDDDDIFLASDDDTDVFHGNVAFRSWIRNVASNPQSLILSSMVYIRKYFINNDIPFKRMKELSLPPKLVRKLRYQNALENAL